ncbi:MAG: hypothetical protein HWN69_05165 [Desulfobacterales bacterium]|nr:hypothetical protein [Desulfobacterales bacterium]
MKRFVVVLITISLLICPSVCFSSYLIELKNGKEFITYLYWEEDDQIKFYFFGGVVGIQKESVRKIRESNVAPGEWIDFEKGITIENETDKRPVIVSPEPARELTKKDGPGKKTGSEKEKTDEKIDFEYYRREKLELTAELDRALERLREATQNKDPKAKKKAREDMRKASGRIYDLTDELKEKNNGVLPNDWWEQ